MTPVLDVLVSAGGLALLVFAFGCLRKKWTVENLPTSRIGSVAMGFAEVQGAARPRSLLKGPLSGRDCAWFRFKVEVERRDSKGRTHWATVSQGTSTETFFLQDEGASLLVDPVGAEVLLDPSFRKVEHGGSLREKKRYTEWIVAPGSGLFVVGTVKKQRDMETDRKVILLDRLRRLKADREAMAGFDADRDGTISDAEWEKARTWVEEELLKEEISRPASADDDNVIGKGEQEKTFLLTDKGERAVLGSLAFRGWASLSGGVALFAAGLVSLLARVGLLPPGISIPWKGFFRFLF